VDETVANDGFPGFFAEARTWVERWESIVPYAIPVEILSILVFLAAFVFLMCAAGHRGARAESDGEEIRLYALDTIWFEVVTGVAFLAGMGILLLMAILLEEGALTVASLLTVETELASAFCLVILLYLMTFAARIKAKKFWRYTCVYWCWKGCVKLLRKGWNILCQFWNNVPGRFFRWMAERRRAYKEFARTHHSIVRRTVVILLVLTVVLGITLSFYSLYGFYSYCGNILIFWFLGMTAVMWVFTLAAVSQMVRLQEGSKRLADGDFSEPIDTRGLFWEFKVHAENINRAGDGVASAVEKQMKSEHFRTELITNVSHDIKTPLTSIINYVDLLQKQNPENETEKEYLEVLARQSARLKKLLEDLLEASKASTGNLTVNFETCDACVLLTQIVGEFEEKTAANQLELIVDNPKEALHIRVDSRHIWRVFDNLLGNICKYAQPGTRVYISLMRDGGDAVISMKNISKYQLNITSDELMERFVRGDSSRNTEGSGLGLSIAQSLTNLMNGTMNISVDGDLFKVILRFPVV
jgi:signal transduction histidine kinase